MCVCVLTHSCVCVLREHTAGHVNVSTTPTMRWEAESNNTVVLVKHHVLNCWSVIFHRVCVSDYTNTSVGSLTVLVCVCFGSGSVGARLSTSTSPLLSRPSPRTSTLKGSTLVPMSTRPPQHVTRLSRFLLWNCVYNVPPNTAGSQCLITVLLWWNYSVMTHKDHICVVSAHLCVFPRRML